MRRLLAARLFRTRVIGMDRKKLVIIISAAVILVAAILLFLDAGRIGEVRQTAGETTGTQASAAPEQSTTAGSQESGSTDADSTSAEIASTQDSANGSDAENLINREKVEVNYNTPEYDLGLELCEDSGKKTFIRMQYYQNGTTVVNELDDGELPELANLFESRAEKASGDKAFRIGQALLNPVHSQLYLLINGTPLDAYVQSSFYLVDLNDMSVKKLFSSPGKYGKMTFNKDYSMLAWSFGDPPVMSAHQEDNLLEIFDCAAGDFLVKGNVYTGGKRLGSNSDPKLLYDYEFVSWKSTTVLKLKQAVRPLSNPDGGLTQTDVLYDIKKNLLLNPDGSEQKLSGGEAANGTTDSGKPGTATGGAVSGNAASGNANSGSAVSGDREATGKADGDNPADAAESEPLKTLKAFYSYLGSLNNYAKAMNLLDDNFKLRLQLMKQFGAEELVKSDIDKENASLYSELLRTARFDSLSQEVTKDGVSSILYFQILEPSPGTEINQQMTATLKKTSKGWKITLIEDGLD